MKKLSLIIIFLSLFAMLKAQAVYFRIGSETDAQGTEVVIPVKVEDFTDILSMQGTISFDPSVVSFVNTENYALTGLNATCFGTTNVGSGKLTFSWYDASLLGQNLADNDTVFSIRFLITGASGTSTSIQLTDDITTVEVVDNSYSTLIVYDQTGSVTVSEESPVSDDVTFLISDYEGENGTSIEVPVTVQKFEDIITAQGTIEFDETIISYSGISSFGLPSMSLANFGTGSAASGILTFSWNDPTLAGVTMADDAVIFTIEFDIIGAEGQISPVNVISTPTPIEVADVGLNILDYSVNNGSVTVGETLVPDGFTILADSVEAAIGQYVEVPVRATDFVDLITAQGSITFNTSVATFDQITYFGLPDLSAANFGLTQTASGIISFSWNDPSLVGVTMADNDILFTLQFLVVGSIGEETPLTFGDSPTSLEFVDNDFTVIPYDTENGNIKVIDLYELEITSISGTEFCAGEEIIVDYSAIGSYTGTNAFTVMLSDETGDFTSATDIGSVVSAVSGSVTATIPLNILESSLYKIKIVATDPFFESDVYGTDLTLHPIPLANAGTDEDICIGNSVTLTATGGDDYEWSSGQLVDVITVSPLVDTEYIVTVTDSHSCENTDTVNVIVHDLPTVNAGFDEDICIGESVTLTATGGDDYEWSSGELIDVITVSPLVDTEYIVTVTDTWMCENTDTVNVNVFEVFADAGTDEEICIGGSVTLTATGGTGYEWSTGEFVDVITVSPTIDTEYIVTVTGVNSCTDTDTVNVIVYDLPLANAGTDEDICIGNSVTLTATGGDDYEWSSGQLVDVITVSPIVDTEYIVTVIDLHSCENTDTVNVIVHNVPTVNAGSDEDICIGESVTLTATGGDDYEWSSGQLVDVITVSPLVDTEYIVTVTDTWMCENTDTVNVNVFEVFADAGTDEEICIGGSVTLTATGGTGYEWSTGDFVDAITVSPTIDTEYIVTVTGVNSCTDTETVNVIVYDLPLANAGTDEDICIGNSVTLTATGGDDYEWSSGQFVDAITVSPLVDTEYIVTVTDSHSCENTDTVNVIVHDLPTVNAGSDEDICIGESVILTATGGDDYEWSSGQLVDVITVSPTVDTEYIVTVTDIWMCENTDTVNVNVFEVFADAGTDEEICIGGSVTLTATGGTGYEWSTGDFVDAITVSPLVDTEYIVTVTGVNSCTDTDTVNVIVYDLPLANAGTDEDICIGNSVTLTATGGDDYEWSSGQLVDVITVSPLVDTEYIVTVTDSHSCENTDTVNVIVHDLPIVNAGSDEDICIGESVILTATGGDDYEWSSGQLVDVITVSPLVDTEYIVTVTDTWMCENTDTVNVNVFEVFADAGIDEEICIGGSVTLTATGGTGYEWSTGEFVDVITVSPTIDIEYIVTVTGVNSCTDTDTVNVIVYDLPLANAGTDEDICIGNSVTLTATGGDDYEWSSGQLVDAITVNPLVDTEYIVTVTDSHSCENTDTVNVIVHDLPTVNAGSDEDICIGESVILTATGGDDYEWSSGQLVDVITVSPLVDTEYIVTATDIWMCENTDTVNVNVFEVFADAGTDEEICIGGSVTLTATGGTGYEWSTGDFVDVITVSPTADTEYIVTVTGVNSCTDTDTVNVIVYDLPLANAGTDEDICIGNSVTLTATGGDDYEWSFGQFVDAITVSPLVDTEYIVTVTDSHSCENTDTVNVIVHDLPTVNAGSDEDICIGESVILTATGGDDYEWSSGQLVDVITVSPTVDTEYIVTVTDIWMCENTDTVNVNVFEVDASAGDDEEICIGGSVSLSASGGTDYHWSTLEDLQTIEVSPLADTEYIVTVTGVNMCTDTDTVWVIVLDVPSVPDMPNGITERCQADGTDVFTTNLIADASYNWVVYPIETGVSTPTDNSLSVEWDIAFTGETGIYVEATNICGFSHSDTLIVQTNPSPFPNLGNDTTICVGNCLTLDAGIADSWTWSNGADTQTTEVCIEGSITVESFIGTCSNTDELYVTLSEADVEFGQDTIHSDVPVTLDAGPGFSEYLWNDDSTEQTLEVSNSGWYYVTVTNEFGCTDTDSIYYDFVSEIEISEMPVEFTVYPNPTNGKFVIETSSTLDSNIQIDILNSLGQHIRTVETQDSFIELDISEYESGLYFVRVWQNDHFEVLKLTKK